MTSPIQALIKRAMPSYPDLPDRKWTWLELTTADIDALIRTTKSSPEITLTTPSGSSASELSRAHKVPVTNLHRVLRTQTDKENWTPKTDSLPDAIIVFKAEELPAPLAADLLATSVPTLLITTGTPQPRSFLDTRKPHNPSPGVTSNIYPIGAGQIAIAALPNGDLQLLVVSTIPKTNLIRGQRYDLVAVNSP